MKRRIEIACKTLDTMPLDKLVEFQGELKHLSEDALAQLINEIMLTGFAFPVHVWERKGKVYIIGGHQRVKALKRIQDAGWTDSEGKYWDVEIPPVPVVRVLAKTRELAARRVLQDVAQYGAVTAGGLKGFAARENLDLKSIQSSFRMPDLDLRAVFTPPVFNPGTLSEQGQLDAKKTIIVYCPHCKKGFDQSKARVKN